MTRDNTSTIDIMTVLHFSKLLKPSFIGANWCRRPNYLASYVSSRYVQEFPSIKMNNELHRDYLLVLPEQGIETPETNEALRLPKLGDPETDFSKINAESIFKGWSQAVTSFNEYVTDFNNNDSVYDKPIKEFFKDIERHLYPMDTAYNIYFCLFMVDQDKFQFDEFKQLLERYFETRSKRLEGSFKSTIEEFAHHDHNSLTDCEKKLLKIYHPRKRGTYATNLDTGHLVNFARNLKMNANYYYANVRQVDKLFSYTVDDPDMLAAISPEFEDSQDLHHKERTPLKITTSTYSRFMQVCPDRFVRQMLWQTWNKRCSPKGEPRYNNLSLIDDIRVIRRKLSNLRGYRTHVEFTIDDAMAQSKKQIEGGLKSLNQENIAKLKERLQELQQFADDCSEGSLEDIQDFDVDYWAYKYRYEIIIGKSESDLKAYFPLDVVMRGLISYFANYFGIEMRIRSEPSKFWDESVQVLDVTRNNQPLGTILFDPYLRLGKKVPYSFYCRLRMRDSVINRSPPLRLISTTFKREPSSNQAYLAPTEIVDLMTYYSTVLQRLLYNYDYYELNTYGALELDANNLLPNLCRAHLLTDYRILQSCSDRGSSKTIDAELASRIIKSLTYLKSTNNWRELYKAHLDLEAHSSLASIKSIVQELYPIYSPFMRDPDNYDHCAMSEIFVGPHDGAYYSDLWSKQLANYCLQHSLSGSDIATSDVAKLRDFNAKLLDTLFDSEKLNTSDKLASLTGQIFDPSKIGLGVL